MDAFLFADYRRGGGDSSFRDWELSADVTGWEDAPAPAQVGKRIVEGLFQTKLPPSSAQLVGSFWSQLFRHGLSRAYFHLLASFVYEPFVRAWHQADVGALLRDAGFELMSDEDEPPLRFLCARKVA